MVITKRKVKILTCASLSTLMISSTASPSNALRVNNYDNINVDIDSVAVIDQENGDLLYGQKEDKVRNIASVTKCMTLLLTLEAIDRGDLTLDKVVEIKEVPDAWGSCFGFKKGDKYTIHDLLEMAMIISANDACVVLAGVVSGSVENFVKDMNEKASQLGMTHTKFFNPNGLPLGREDNADGGNVSTARDIAYLVKFINDNYFDIVHEITTKKSLELKGMESPRPNTNKLIFRNANNNGFVVDGFKTGYTEQAGFCLVTTSEHDNGTPNDSSDDFRTIGVSLGGESFEPRFYEHARMLQYVTDSYKNVKLASKNEVVKTINTYNDPEYDIKLVPQSDLEVLSYKGDKKDYIQEITVNKDIEYPVKKGDVLGRMEFTSKTNPSVKYSVNLVSSNNVAKRTFFEKLFKGFK